MGVGRDLRLAEAAHLRPDRLKSLVEPGVADRGRALTIADQGDEAGAMLGGVAVGDQGLDGPAPEPGRVAGGKAQGRQADDLALAHGNAAEDLVERLAETDADQQTLGLAEAVLRGQALDGGGKLADRLAVGGKPGEAVGGVLLGL